MPIYEYRCSKCNDRFELIQSFSDQPLKKCKKCGGALQKLVSECAFHLKGTGWYVSDYGKTGSNSKPKNSTSAKKEKSEDKPKPSPTSSSNSSD